MVRASSPPPQNGPGFTGVGAGGPRGDGLGTRPAANSALDMFMQVAGGGGKMY